MSRAWGTPVKTPEDETIIDVNAGLSNRQLLDQRSQRIQEQDKALDVIYASVNRQKNMANVFSEEVDSQIHLLDSIDRKVDRNDGKVKAATEHVEQVEAEASTKALWIIICILIAVLITVCILAWYT